MASGPSEELIARLTGVRSAKPSYYQEYRYSEESLDRSIRALESATGAMSDVLSGPRQLAEDFVRSTVRIFDAPWAVLVAEHPAFGPVATVLAATSEGLLGADEHPPGWDGQLRAAGGPAEAARMFEQLTEVAGGRWLTADLTWPDGHGWLAAGLAPGRAAGPTEQALLATLAHQVTASIRSAHLFAEAERLRAEAAEVREELAGMRARETVDREREHLARDLHDTVAQQVLGIGLKLEQCRAKVADDEVASLLLETRELARATIGRIRSTIAELTAVDGPAPVGLAERLDVVVGEFAGRGPKLRLDLTGDLPELPAATVRAVEMIAREAVANAIVHAGARQVDVVAGPDGPSVVLVVADDGQGRPAALAEHLREAVLCQGTGHGRGLANAFLRAREAGGTLEIEEATGAGGVALRVTVPILPGL